MLGATAAPAPGTAAARAALKAGTAASPDAAPAADALDDLVGQALADWQPAGDPLFAPLLAEIEAAAAAGETPERFRARLAELLPRLDASALAERLAQAMFAARLAGEAGLDPHGRRE